MKSMIPVEQIENIIYVVRGYRVILDADLAMIYGVETKAFNRAIDRNRARFPEDFAFRLTEQEWKILRCQSGTSSGSKNSLRCQIGTLKKQRSTKRGKHTKYLPRVFTEHGAYAAAFVLRSSRAQVMSVEVVRAFVRMRKLLAFDAKFTKELQELRSFVLKRFHKTDQEFVRLWKSIDKLLNPPVNTNRIGFDLSQ